MGGKQRVPSARDRLLSGGAWAFFGRATATVTALVSNALLARLLSPQDLGTYFLAYSIVGLGWLLGSLGLHHAVVRFVAESVGLDQQGRARRVVVKALILCGAGSLGVGLAYLLFGDLLTRYLFGAPALATVTGLVAGWIAVTSLQGLLAEVFRGFHDIRLATVFGNFGGLLTSILLVVLLTLLWAFDGKTTLDVAILVAVGASGASTLLAGLALRRKLASLPWREDETGPGYGEVLGVALPVLTTNVTLFVLAQADLWVVGASLPQEEVAVYGAAARTVLLVGTPLVIANQIVPPLIAEMYAQGKKQDLERTLRAVATLAGIPAFVALLGFVLLGEPLLGLVFGDYYRGGALVLALLSVGQMVNVWTGTCQFMLIMTGHQATMMVVTVMSGAATVLAEFWAVGHYGALGVAAAAAGGIAIQNAAILVAVKRKTGVWTHAGLAGISDLTRAARRRGRPDRGAEGS